MDPSTPRRHPGNGYSSGSPARTPGTMDPSARPGPLRLTQGTPQGQLGPAERFEDEKRRIASTCFAKAGEDGKPQQNYITHVRVEEDAQYPSTPPPPHSDRKNKKDRVIVIAVKTTGRVCMHKARENPDGSFQIGKTWPLEELSQIELFRDDPSLDAEARQRAQWAGDHGLVITLSKPYYWRANTAKEKEFFVASVVKIYRKYTSGNVPQMIGFSPAQIDDIMGGVPAQPPALASPSQRPRGLREGSPGAARQGQPPPVAPPPVFAPTVGAPVPGPPGRTQSPLHSRPGQRDGSQIRERSVDSYGQRPGPPMAGRVTPKTSQHALNDRYGAGPGDGPKRPFEGPSESLAARSVNSLQSNGSDGSLPGQQPQSIPERRRPPLAEGPGIAPARSRGESSNGHPTAPDPRLAGPRPDRIGSPPSAPTPPPVSTPTPPPIQERSSQRSTDRTAESPGVSTSETESAPQPAHRPGLGPMTGPRAGGDTASKFRKAAAAASAFRPRAGGAGARLLGTTKKSEDEIPSPSTTAPLSDVEPSPVNPSLPPIEPITTTQSVSSSIQATPLDKVAQANALRSTPTEAVPSIPDSLGQNAATEAAAVSQAVPQPPQEPSTQDSVSPEADQQQYVSADVPQSLETVMKKNRPNKYEHAFAALDIDPDLFASQRVEYETTLADFGWEASILHGNKADLLESDLRREITRLEAGSWLGTSDQKDERVEVVEKMLDKAIAECDEMEGLLTLYAVELSSLTEDIAYIEAQGHGLQVQTANQKILHAKLQDLVETVSIDPSQLEPLRRSSIRDIRGLDSVESCLVELYKAIETIDPSALSGKSVANGAGTDESLANMRALRERKGAYLSEIHGFLGRLRQEMDPVFAMAFARASDSIKMNKKGTLDLVPHESARAVLWQYSPLMLFAKEVDMATWKGVMGVYLGRAAIVYGPTLRDNMAAWKSAGRQSTVDEQRALFTAQEKESESLTSTAKKITVKRSQMLARGLMTGSFEKRPKLNKNPGAKHIPYEAFNEALSEMLPLMTSEQNFIVDFFHTTTLENTDFADAASVPVEERRGQSTSQPKAIDPDRTMANRVLQAMDQVFGFWPAEIQGLVDWAVASNELFTTGVLLSIEQALASLDPSQEFIIKTLQNVEQRLSQVFMRSVESQVRWIEDTKVKIKKRSGVVGFMKVFPSYVGVVESMLPAASEGSFEIRDKVDQAYDRINRAMFDSLKVIAKESPGSVATGAMYGQSADPDDKEALNYHIMLIGNMHHYTQEVEEHDDRVLGKWRGQAMLEMAEHQEQYVNAVIRRPLGRLLDFVESIESIRMSSGMAPQAIPTSHPSHSNNVFRKMLNSYGAKDLRKGVDALRARVEKHFAEADEASISAKLVNTILSDCERRYVDVVNRTKRIASDVYQNTIEVEFGLGDVQTAFRRG